MEGFSIWGNSFNRYQYSDDTLSGWKINFYYGTVNSSGSLNWIAGISNGDGVNYKYTAITDSLAQPTPNTLFSYTTQPFPTEMSLSDNGLFSGTPSKTYVNLPIKFYVEDNNFLHDTRTLNFNTKGVEISYQVTAGNDSIIEYGENVFLTPTLRNVSNMVLHNVVMKLGLNDNFIISIDSTQNIGTLNPGQVLTLPNAFHFSVLNSIPDMHLINLYSQVLATEENFNLTIQLPARAAKLEVVNVSVSDGNNNILMPGETGNILISLKNSGGSDATGLTSLLTSIDPYITIVQGNFAFDTLSANTTTLLNFAIQVTPACPNGHIGYLNFTTEADKDLLLYDSLFIPIGNIVEDFETGNLTRFPWQKSGNSDWSISLTTPYEGTFCAESGSMIDNQECSLFLELEVLSASEISFYRKVSSEVNYDFLYFYIDGAEMGKWSGDVPGAKLLSCTSWKSYL
ncbi:MAG: hypothetical protein IPH45_07255 [Bacteroidales bacterium]|nr:hypothetical protein [Bacteroidales bacterium]